MRRGCTPYLRLFRIGRARNRHNDLSNLLLRYGEVLLSKLLTDKHYTMSPICADITVPLVKRWESTVCPNTHKEPDDGIVIPKIACLASHLGLVR